MAQISTRRIEPKEWYNLQDIIRKEMFPWARSFWKVRNLIALDLAHKNILKVVIQGEGRGKKYLIKGEYIIRFIRKFEANNLGF